MGLGTCWVAGTYDRKKIIVPDHEKLLCVIPTGYPADDDFFVPQTNRKRKPAEKRFRIDNPDAKLPEKFINGIAAMCQAPSAINSQKSYIDIKSARWSSEGRTTGNSELDYIDLGIAERHFAIGADQNITTAYFMGEFRRSQDQGGKHV